MLKFYTIYCQAMYFWGLFFEGNFFSCAFIINLKNNIHIFKRHKFNYNFFIASNFDTSCAFQIIFLILGQEEKTHDNKL
jgi:hypothetical protein